MHTVARSDKTPLEKKIQKSQRFTHRPNDTPHSRVIGRPGSYSEGQYTRSHPELGRENPQRQWYYVSRRGRVGRRQVFQ